MPSFEMYSARAFFITQNRIAMVLLQMPSSESVVNTSSDDMIIALTLLGIFAFYILLCVLVGRYAKKHSRSFWGFFILSLFLSPFWGFIIAIIAGGETEKQRENRIRRETEIRMEMENQYRQQFNQITPPPIVDENNENL